MRAYQSAEPGGGIDGHDVLGRHSRNTAPTLAVIVVLPTPPFPRYEPDHILLSDVASYPIA